MSEQRRRGPMGGHGRMMSGEKAKDFKGSMAKLFRYMGRYKFRFILMFIFAVAGTVFSIVGPKILGKATTAFLKLYKLFRFIFYPHYCNTVFFNFKFQLYYNSSITFFNKNGPATCVARPLLSNTISSSSPYPPPSLSAVSVSSLVLQLSSD